jgi:hypothetical protein
MVMGGSGHTVRRVLTTAVLVMVLTGAASRNLASPPESDFSRYEVILARMPFGQEPPPEAAGGAAPNQPPQDPFTKTLKMCAITQDDVTGLRVGLVDIKSNKNYFMAVGDVEDGMELVEADYAAEKALLRKGPEQYWISMSDAAGSVAMVSAASGPAVGRGVFGGGLVTPLPPTRREIPRQSKLRDSGLKGEALEKHLQEVQMRLVRAKGEEGPPLPVPLTREMDDQLVAEGVLPPQEE